MNTYIDAFDFTRSTHGLEIQSLIGNQARLTTAQTVGSASLTGIPVSGLNSITVALNMFDRLTLFDGSSTEVVQVGSAGAAIGATSIPLLTGTTLQFNHALGVAWLSDGFAGSLADQIVNASSWIEQTCYQALLQTTYTNEQVQMPSSRAAIGNDGALTFRPRHWPITSISTVSVATVSLTQPIGFDTTQLFIDGDKRLCSISNLVVLPASMNNTIVQPALDRNGRAQLLLTYQAGYPYASLPGDLKEAAILVTSDLLAKRHNPIGAPDISDGSTHVSAVLRGDLTGESILIKRAMEILSRYNVSLF
jgi:hypothetical protein